MPTTRITIIPNCRYDHGDLTLVLPERDKDGNPMHWGYVPSKMPQLRFEGDLYICTTCGYTEFFDNDPTLTLLNNELNGGPNGGS